MDHVSQLRLNILSCINGCIAGLQDNTISLDLLLVRLESILEAIEEIAPPDTTSWSHTAIYLLHNAIGILERLSPENGRATHVGRPRLHILPSTLEYLLSIKFTVVDIAKILGVSRGTISGRMRSLGLSVSQTYTQITDENLDTTVLQISTNFPNTGYKKMKGFLHERGIKVTEQRIRNAIKRVDPEGVYQRTMQNRCIVRRQYFVSFFNQLWHLDTNMKLIRWNIVIRSCIDGKSRLVTYLESSGDNTAESNLASFLKAVASYGVPYRTRSDKGGENVLIARFMIEQRGEGRASHICGRSVHNQRIERYWRDVFYGYTSGIYNVFTELEEEGYLNIDNPKHIALLHYVFIRRINKGLETFRNAWNHHPLSTERNYTPTQLMIMNLPPPHYDLQLTQDDIQSSFFVCDRVNDTMQLLENGPDSIVSPNLAGVLSAEELERLSGIDVLRESTQMGYDIFVECFVRLAQ